jgi:hypothetical protein
VVERRQDGDRRCPDAALRLAGGVATASFRFAAAKWCKRERMATGNYWIGVVSRAHAQLGVAGGFLQLGHGKRAPLARLRAGDGIVLYSPRTAHPDGEPLQSFTAIGTVTTGEIYQVEMMPQFQPYRVDVAFQPCREAPIKPLLDDLSFVADRAHWGAALRFGQLKISPHDFALIAQAMGCAALAKAAA